MDLLRQQAAPRMPIDSQSWRVIKKYAIRDGCHRQSSHSVVQITQYEFRVEEASRCLTLLVKAIDPAAIIRIDLRHLHKEAQRLR